MKKIEFSVDSLKLKGVIISPKKLRQKTPAVLFIHGWTSHKERSYQYAEGLAKLGYISFLFDMRGHGESEGYRDTSVTKEFLDDVLAAYDYLTTIKAIDANNISAVSSSFGCYLAALLTAKRNIKRLVLRAPADYPNNTFKKSASLNSAIGNPSIVTWRTQARKPRETFALAAVHNFNGEILIIESEKDNKVPHQTVQNYINAVKSKTKLTHIVIKGAPHSIKKGKFRDKVEKILTDWFGTRSN